MTYRIPTSILLTLLIYGVSPLTAQSVGDQSNGALEMSVVHASYASSLPAANRGSIAKVEPQDRRGVLTIAIRNVSTELLTVIVTNVKCDYAIDIRDSSGKPPKLTELGEQQMPKSPEERAVCPVLKVAENHLRPGDTGDTIVEELDLNRLFELDPAKSYGITIARVKGLPAATPSGRALRRYLSQTLRID